MLTPTEGHAPVRRYVDVGSGAGMEQFLVDTGSSYTTINEKMLADLVASEQAEYIKELEGVLADG